MTTRFGDSFYYLALLNPQDRAHRAAVGFPGLATDRIVTTSWILVEVADALSSPRTRPLVPALIAALRRDPLTEILPPDPDLFDRGLDLYARRPDKSWSLTDCISFIVMEQYGLAEALTGDRHFEQAGFRALLRAEA